MLQSALPSTPVPLERQRAHPAPSPSRLSDFHKTVDSDASEPDQKTSREDAPANGLPSGPLMITSKYRRLSS